MARKPNPIPTAPTGRPPTSATPAKVASIPKPKPAAKPASSSTSKKSGGGGGGASGYEKRAIARENKAKRDLANRYLEQAANLEVQAKALQHALNRDFEKGLRQQLSDINESLRQQQTLVREGYQRRYGQLKGAKTDNDKAQVSQSGINDRNMIRERNSAIGEAMNMGAGESDVLATQMMSLRNWHANQTEVQRGYFDTLRSINSSLTDLEIDTKTALANNALQANADKEQLWTNYRNQRSEAYTQLGNVRGQQADYYVQANEMVKDIDVKDDKKAGGKKAGDKKPAGKKGAGPKDAGPKQASRLVTWAGGAGNQQLARRPQPAVETNEYRKGNGGRGTPEKVLDQRGQKKDEKPSWWQTQIDRAQSGLKKAAQADRAKQQKAINRTADNAAEAKKMAGNAFLNASKEMGKSWDNPGIPDGIMEWEGRPDFAPLSTNLARVQAARTVKLDKRPEGATLRKW